MREALGAWKPLLPRPYRALAIGAALVSHPSTTSCSCYTNNVDKPQPAAIRLITTDPDAAFIDKVRLTLENDVPSELKTTVQLRCSGEPARVSSTGRVVSLVDCDDC